MKKLAILLTLLPCIWGISQNEIASKKRVFFSSGFVTPQFFSGIELMSSSALRDNGQSYFEDQNGLRNNVGDHPSNAGFSLGIGYYIPINKIKGLSVGLLVNSAQTGSTPSEGGYEEGYFFNFLNFGLGLQYYPFEHHNLYLKGEVGMGSVFTKNRFINERNEQDYLHHFGIGLESGGGFGYTLTPFTDKSSGINLEVNYQYYATRVEVSGVGNDQWRFGALHINAGLQF